MAELQDRMHLKTTYYNYARHTEAIGEYTAAINRYDTPLTRVHKCVSTISFLFPSYEKSETHQFEVPRMLLDDPLELENYVMKSKDR